MTERVERKPTGRRRGVALIALGLVGVVVALVISGSPWAVHGYFFAFWFCLDLALGSMMIVLIHRLTDGEWGDNLAVPLHAMVATLPLLFLAMVPLWFVLEQLFLWVRMDSQALELRAHQSLWLQSDLHILRSVIYFVPWLYIAAVLCGFIRRREPISGGWAAGALIAFVFATTLFAVDWIMTLVPRNSTTMIGFLTISGQLAAATAAGACYMGLNPRFNVQTDACRNARNDVGNLLLAAVMFYGYCLFMDYLVVWEANLPPEIAWYLERGARFSGALIAAAVLLQLVLPLCLLLFRRIKRSPAGLAAVGAMVLAGHALQVIWNLSPVLPAAPAPRDVLLPAVLFLLLVPCWLMAAVFMSRGIDRYGKSRTRLTQPQTHH